MLFPLSSNPREPYLCTCYLNLAVGAKTLKKHSKLQETHLPISSGQFYPLHQQRPKAEFCIGSPSRAVLYERVGFNHICGLNCKQMIWLHGTAEPKGLANGVKKGPSGLRVRSGDIQFYGHELSIVMSTVPDAVGPITPSLTLRFLFEHTFAQLHFSRLLPDHLYHPNGTF